MSGALFFYPFFNDIDDILIPASCIDQLTHKTQSFIFFPFQNILNYQFVRSTYASW